MNEFENLKFASLLHDIGKFYQRTGKSHSDEFNNVDFGYSGAHSKWSADFISKYWNNDIANLALYHHNFKQAENILLEEIIVSSDSHSAFERIKSEDKQDVLQTPLLSIFSKINIGDNCDLNEYYVPLQPLTLDNGLNYLKPTERKVMEGWNLTPEYQRLWTKFEKEMGKIKNPYDFKTILSLLRKYTSTMPSAAYVSEADISLYDHLKTTSAISIARYNYLNEVKDLKKTSNQEVYLAINGDISGIQDFIYKVSSPQDAQKGMSKRLRGRSLYLTLLCDAIVQYIIKMLNLDECNILFVGGGRFTILAHNTQNVKNKLDNLKNKLNKKFIEDFDAELYLVLTYVSFAGKDFKHFNEVTRELSKLSEEEKKHKFNNELENIFKFESPKYQKACNVCGNLINTNQSTCDTCLKHENLGLDIANAKYMIKCISETNHKDFSLYFEELNIGYIFKKSSKNLKEKIETYTENFEHINVSRLNDTDFLNLNNELNSFDNVSYTFSFIGNNVPIVNNKDVLRFDELADISKGANKIGILKMDVDNLGKVFSLGFGKGKDSSLSISRVSTLSSMLLLLR